MKVNSIGVFVLVLLVFGFIPFAYAQQECTEDFSVSADEVFEEVAAFCCNRANTRKCLSKQLTAMRKGKVKNWMGADVFNSARTVINALKAASCNTDQVTPPACTDETSITRSEALSSVRDSACDLKFQSSRKSQLNKLAKGIRRSKNAIDPDYAAALLSSINDLKTANNCGGGGQQNTLGCNRIVNPRDGANGNVWKRADHSCGGVFVTHDGARNGRIVSKSGSQLSTLRYTGLGNRDPRGLRHHYRTPGCCSSLPSFFYLDIGDTCYEINNRCGRID